MTKAIYGFALCVTVMILIVTNSSNADVLYESTMINTDGGGLNATSWPSLDDGLILVDDITVPADGWTIEMVSNFFGTLGSPTAGTAYLVVFPKSLGSINPMDYAIEVPVTEEIETFVDQENGYSRDTHRIDASGLNLTLDPGDYWIGLSPISDSYSNCWMAWGSRTPSNEGPIWYDVIAGGWVTIYGFWTGPDEMLRIQGSTGIVSVSDADVRPSSFQLHSNFPNPFNPTTTIQYDLTQTTEVSLEIYDILGRKIETLVNATQDAGCHQAIWNGNNRSSGVYFYTIKAGDKSETKRMLLMK